jgi:hypothetical protein
MVICLFDFPSDVNMDHKNEALDGCIPLISGLLAIVQTKPPNVTSEEAANKRGALSTFSPLPLSFLSLSPTLPLSLSRPLND